MLPAGNYGAVPRRGPGAGSSGGYELQRTEKKRSSTRNLMLLLLLLLLWCLSVGCWMSCGWRLTPGQLWEQSVVSGARGSTLWRTREVVLKVSCGYITSVQQHKKKKKNPLEAVTNNLLSLACGVVMIPRNYLRGTFTSTTGCNRSFSCTHVSLYTVLPLSEAFY